MNAQQLKNAILQEAIEGRLVPQDPNDEPASVLLERIRKEKERLVQEGKLKKKDLEVKPISEDEIPFEIPKSWEWCRIIDVVNDIADIDHKMPPVSENGIPYISPLNFKKDGSIDYDCAKKISEEDFRQLSKKCKPERGDLIFPRYGTIGVLRKVETDIDFLVSYSCATIKPHLINIDSNYIYYVLNSPLIQNEEIKKYINKTTQPNIGLQSIKLFLVPLPPLVEQHRIVEKIEELLPKVEKYGKAQDDLNILNEELPEKLKKSILQEAIEGRLVPQDPNDEPASVLLEKIREEKKQLVKEGKLKKKDLEEKPISEDEIPFEIPESWEWCRLGDIGIFERGSGIKRDETLDKGYPCVRYGEMYTKYKYAPTFEKTVSFTSKSVFEKCRKAHKGDLFMALTGENKQDISLAAQYVGDWEIAVGGDLCHFTILKAYPLFFVYLINSTYFSSKKEVLATGDIIVHISTDKLASIPIPFPPLAEQHRIVAKIEELLQKIEGLKK
jgi:type I restriction enzyme S subunit